MIAYPLVMMVVLGGYGLGLGHIPSLAAVPIVLTGEAVVFFGRGYRWLQGQVVGLNFIVMGLVLLAVAQAISASKAGLLSRWFDRGKEDMAEPWI